MKNTTKILTVAVVLAVLVFAWYKVTHTTEVQVTASPTGTTFNSAKVAAVIFAPATGSATSTSLLNSEVNDRYITDSFVMCRSVGTSKAAYSGGGLDLFRFIVGTTSSAITQNLADVNTRYAANLVLGTSTVDSFTASSTEGVIPGTSRVWPAGSYLTIQSNATNTAVCNVGVRYIGS